MGDQPIPSLFGPTLSAHTHTNFTESTIKAGELRWGYGAIARTRRTPNGMPISLSLSLGETDQTTPINSTEHPESCQLASSAKILRRRKSTSVLSIEAVYEHTPSTAERPKQHWSILQKQQQSVISKIQCKDQPQQECNYYFESIAIERQSERPPKISTLFQFSGSEIGALKQRQNPQSHSNPVSKTAIEMNKVKYRPIDSCINTLTSSTWPHEEPRKMERPEPSISTHRYKE